MILCFITQLTESNKTEAIQLAAFFPGLMTLFGAIIGATVSYMISRYQFRVNVLSKNRQDWITNVRTLFSNFHYSISKSIKLLSDNIDNAEYDFVKSKFEESELLYSQIILYLNEENKTHVKIITEARGILNNIETLLDRPKANELHAKLDGLVVLFRSALDKESQAVRKAK